MGLLDDMLNDMVEETTTYDKYHKALDVLYAHVVIGKDIKNSDVDLLKFLEKKFKSKKDFKNQGVSVLYRSIGVQGDKISNLFKNQAFTTEDFSKKTAVESWTIDEDVAYKHITDFLIRYLKYKVNIILISPLSKLSPILWYGKNIRRDVLKDVKKLEGTKLSRLGLVPDEQELIVKSQKERKYNLCNDIIFIGITSKFFVELGYKIPSYISDLLSQEDMEILREDIKFYIGNYIFIFECDGEYIYYSRKEKLQV